MVLFAVDCVQSRTFTFFSPEEKEEASVLHVIQVLQSSNLVFGF